MHCRACVRHVGSFSTRLWLGPARGSRRQAAVGAAHRRPVSGVPAPNVTGRKASRGGPRPTHRCERLHHEEDRGAGFSWVVVLAGRRSRRGRRRGRRRRSGRGSCCRGITRRSIDRRRRRRQHGGAAVYIPAEPIHRLIRLASRLTSPSAPPWQDRAHGTRSFEALDCPRSVPTHNVGPQDCPRACGTGRRTLGAWIPGL